MKNLFNHFKFLFPVVALCALQACQQEPDYKAVRQQVIDLHDKLMGDDEKAMRNQMKLDTLITPAGLHQLKQTQPQLDTAMAKQQMSALIKQLQQADDAMNDWMHRFNPDVQGQNNQQAVSYFNTEKKKVVHLDGLFKAAIQNSSAYLNKLNVKTDTGKATGHMEMKM